MRSLRVIALGVIDAANTIRAEVLDHAEGGKVEAALVALGVAHAAGAIDTVIIETVTLVVIQAGDAAHTAIGRLFAEGCIVAAARIIGHITDDAVIGDTLAEALVLTLGILSTRNTLIALIACNADAERPVASVVTPLLTRFADPQHTLVESWFLAITIAEAGDAIDTARTEWGIATASRVIGHIAESTTAIDALTRTWLVTVAITSAPGTGITPIDAERSRALAARIVRWVTEDAGLINALPAVTVRVPDTFNAP